MLFKYLQSPAAAVMVRPHHFVSNPETAADNAFQSLTANGQANISASALHEFDEAVAQLTAQGIRIHVFDDFGEYETPDSVFPNNWFSTHQGGRVAVFPMYSPSRRRERRHDVLDMLKREYRVQEIVDYSGLEPDQLFLEGTGVMVFDHIERVAYVGASKRADPVILERFCTSFGYEPMVFDTADQHGNAIYHTNVIMAIGMAYALICLDFIQNPERRQQVQQRLQDSGREVIALTAEQIGEFAGNALEMTGHNGRVLVMSKRAAMSLTPEQRAIIEKSAVILPISIPTIELAGGSVRCMIAGVHLTPR